LGGRQDGCLKYMAKQGKGKKKIKRLTPKSPLYLGKKRDLKMSYPNQTF